MIKCTCDRNVKIHSGLIGLDDEQYKKRLHNLTLEKKGVYKIKSMIWLKAGELFSLAEEPNKTSGIYSLKSAKAEAEKAESEKAEAKTKAEAEEKK